MINELQAYHVRTVLIKAKIISKTKIKKYAEIEFLCLVRLSSLNDLVGVPSLITRFR